MKTVINERLTLFADGGQAFAADAFLLAAFVKGGRHAVELGCGSGVCSMLVADRGKFSAVDAYEIQPALADAARLNVEKNGLDGIIRVIGADIRELRRGEAIDTVFANPPYLICDGRESPDAAKNAARREICGDIRDFCAAASRLLTDGGSFFTVYRPDRIGALFAALREAALEPKLLTFVHHNAASDASMVLTAAKKGAKPSLRTTPPLILFDRDGSQSPQAEKIYRLCSFD